MTDDQRNEDEESEEPAEAQEPSVGRLLILSKPEETNEAALARESVNPAFRTAVPLLQWSERQWRGKDSLPETVRALEAEAAAVQRNDLSNAEAMLINQAHLLNTAFTYLMDKAKLNLYSNLDAAEKLARLAFKAQAQCRASLETLSEMKAPKAPATFVKQANFAAGHQQVNNGAGPADQYARAGGRAGDRIPTNELLETLHESRLDARAASPASLANPQLEAVAAIDRPTNSRGKGEGEH